MSFKVVVVGAGPAGLVTAKSLLEYADEEYPFDPVVLEQEDDIGGTFRYRSYQNANLVSSKQLTSFSDFRLPLHHHDHLTLEACEEYVQYLRDYCKQFNLTERIHLNTKVVNISRNPGGGHIISFVQRASKDAPWDTTPHTIQAAYVAICSGLHVTPSIPDIPGIQHVLHAQDENTSSSERAVFHSADYKSRSQLAGKRVMILGTGETGMDIAYEAAKAGAAEAVLCSRAGFLSFPKLLNDFEFLGLEFKSPTGVPIDCLITNLGETAYVVGELEPERLGRAYVFLNKSHKAMPYINRPYRKRPAFMEHFSRYIDPVEDSPPNTDFVVDLAPFPTHFLPNGRAVFPLTKRKDAIRMKDRDIRPEVVIYATGYRQEFGFMDPDYPTPDKADVRNVVKEGDETVGFIGFVRPGVGAIPPIAEMQSFFWISLLKNQVRKPLPPPHYHLLVKENARIKYGVDHSTYMSTLAKDIGAAPGLLELWMEHGTRVLICYCFGAAFTTFYRLVGPFRCASAPRIVKTELWDTITRRGIIGNVVMGVIPMAFYLTINATAYVLGTGWAILGGQVE
ncbi:hypothetical protein VNI00_005961 [Paramarasmius palmivorus]|uniref:Flavin-containing monooxygenase n=1 Tax=Paramarasmius palmivorus TaxID=297713 RepID=A0AAW0DAR1_9AGAR